MKQGTRRPHHPTRRFRPTLEKLEDRALPSSTGWLDFAHDPQHTGDASVGTQPLDAIHWSAPVDLNVTGSAVHYGSPVVTANNTVIVPVKTGAYGSFELVAHNGATGAVLWTIASDYTLPPYQWMPPFVPALTANRLYFPGNGGTIYYVNHPDTAGASISGQLAFFGLQQYQANPGAYNSSVMIDTPLTTDSLGNIYFGFQVIGSNPSNLTGGGVARISKGGQGSDVLAASAVSDTYGLGPDKVPLAAAPAVSKDGATLYVSMNNSGSNYGYLLGLDSTTLATKFQTVLKDPRFNNANYAQLLDQSTATPMVAPDGTVFYGIFGNPYNGSRGFLLHFSADLTTEFTPGAFGWDDTPSVVPIAMVPSYHGTSTYLVFSKYNNYVAGETGSSGGPGINEVVVLDPYASQPDTRNDGDPNLLVMNEVLTTPGPTPDTVWIQNGYPNAVREWCINDTAVDPATKSILVNSEDGNFYRWYLPTNTLTQVVTVTSGIGEPYVPSVVGPDGTVFALNGGSIFALGGLPNYTLTETTSMDPAPLNQSVTFTATLASTNGGPTPGGTITFMDGSTTLAKVTIVNGQASYLDSSLSLANHFIKALYSGDPIYPGGSATLVESVRYNDTPVLASSANPSVYGQPVTLTVTVNPVSPGTATPTGNVVFLDGRTFLGNGTLNASGQASLTISTLAVGKHRIRTVYSGDFEYVPTESAALVQRVSAAGAAALGTGPRLAPSRTTAPAANHVIAASTAVWLLATAGFGQQVEAAGSGELATEGSVGPVHAAGANGLLAHMDELDVVFTAITEGLA